MSSDIQVNMVDILHLSDLHLGHQNVNAEYIAEDLRKVILPRVKEVQLVCITGDVFHTSVSLNDTSTNSVVWVLTDLYRECYKHNTALRILQGTYSHDRNQLSILDRIFKSMQLPVNCAIVRTLSVEIVPKLNVSILYVPDNLPYRTKAEVFDQISDLLKANNLKSVDYVLIHGEFEDTCDRIRRHEVYAVRDFIPICHGLILAGHEHRPTRVDNMLYAGSFSRLAHNEEHEKGAWLIKNNIPTFIPNPYAIKFMTVDYSRYTKLEDILAKHDSIMSEHYTSGRREFLRVILSNTNFKTAVINYHESKWPHVHLTFKRENDHNRDTVRYLTDRLTTSARKTEVPSPANIVNIVHKYLTERHDVHLTVEQIATVIHGGTHDA